MPMIGACDGKPGGNSRHFPALKFPKFFNHSFKTRTGAGGSSCPTVQITDASFTLRDGTV